MLSLHNNAVLDLSRTRLSSKKSRRTLDDDCTTKLLKIDDLWRKPGVVCFVSLINPCGKIYFTVKWSEFMVQGALAQLARAPALQAGGPGFESPTLHHTG